MRFRALWPLVLAAAVVAFSLHGCGDSSTGPARHSSDPWLPQTSPANVLVNLEHSFAVRDIARFDSLLYDSEAAGDSTEGFTFVVWNQDVEQHRGEFTSWGRDETIAHVDELFSSPETEETDLDLTWSAPYRDNTLGHEGRWVILVTNSSLSVRTRPPGSTEPLITKVETNLASFRLKVQYMDARGDSIWRIIRVEDLGTQP